MNTNGFIERMRDWQSRVSIYQEKLYKQSGRLESRHYQIGLPATVLSVVAGSTIFLRLESNPDVRIQIGLGALSLLSAVLTGVMTFYSHARRSEHSRSVSAQLGAVRREIDILVDFPPATEALMKEALRKVNDKITGISADAPTVTFDEPREAFICYAPAR